MKVPLCSTMGRFKAAALIIALLLTGSKMLYTCEAFIDLLMFLSNI